MAFTVVQNTNQVAAGNSPVSAVFTNTPTQGNLMLASVCNTTNATLPTVSDGTNPWTLLNSYTTGKANEAMALYGFIAVNTQGKTITATAAASTTLMMNIYELSGNPATITVDQAAQAFGAASALTSNGQQSSVFTKYPGSLIVIQLGTNTGLTAAFTAVSPTGNSTPGLQQNVSASLLDAFFVQSAPGTYNPYFTWTTNAKAFDQLTTAILGGSTQTTDAGSNYSQHYFVVGDGLSRSEVAN